MIAKVSTFNTSKTNFKRIRTYLGHYLPAYFDVDFGILLEMKHQGANPQCYYTLANY